MPVSEDEKRTCVVLRHSAGLAEPDQKGEPRVSVEDGEREDKGEKQNTQTRTRTVRWYKAVDGRVGRRVSLSGWLRFRRVRSS